MTTDCDVNFLDSENVILRPVLSFPFSSTRVLSFRISEMATQLSQQYACQYLSQNTCGLEQARVVNLPLRTENGHYVLSNTPITVLLSKNPSDL